LHDECGSFCDPVRHGKDKITSKSTCHVKKKRKASSIFSSTTAFTAIA